MWPFKRKEEKTSDIIKPSQPPKKYDVGLTKAYIIMKDGKKYDKTFFGFAYEYEDMIFCADAGIEYKKKVKIVQSYELYDQFIAFSKFGLIKVAEDIHVPLANVLEIRHETLSHLVEAEPN